MPYLVVLSGPQDAGRWIPLDHGTWTVGRDQGTTFQLSDPCVSRRQFRICRKDQDEPFTIEPFIDASPTLLAGEEIEGKIILPLDVQVLAGNTLLCLTNDQPHQPSDDPLRKNLQQRDYPTIQ